MPIRRPRLNQTDAVDWLLCLQELRDEGMDVEIPEGLQRLARVVDVCVGSPMESMVYEAGYGLAAGYAVKVRLIAERSRLTLVECDNAAKPNRRWEDEGLLQHLRFSERT